MEAADLALLHEQYHDYFIVEQQINLNVQVFNSALPDELGFEALIPAPFKMVSELAAVDHAAIKSLNRIGEFAEDLASYLRAQSRKIDMMLGFLLQQQDEAQYRHVSHSFGGSACCFYSDTPLEPGQYVQIKMFLNHGEGAVFALAVVLGCQPQANEAEVSRYLIKTTYVRIKDTDRELVVRASLHEQSRQLKRKAELRAQQGNR